MVIKRVDTTEYICRVWLMKAIIVKFNNEVNGSQYVIAPVRRITESVAALDLDALFDATGVSYKFISNGDVKSLNYPSEVLEGWGVDNGSDLIDILFDCGELFIDSELLETTLRHHYVNSSYKEHTLA